MKNLLLLGGLLFALGVPVWSVVQYERLAAASEPMLLELAPVDPRSLIQGDYMVLAYRITRRLQFTAKDEDWPRRGQLAVTLDDRSVVMSARRVQEADELEPGERLVRYQRAKSLQLGAESFFFQEGNAEAYESARYGELRVASDGTALLVGLRDENLTVLGPIGDHPLQQ